MTVAPRILVVDDSPTLRRVIESALLGAEYAGVVCEDLDAVIEDARATSPDLIVLDQVMPGRNSLEIAAALGEEAELANIPILLMCSQTPPEKPLLAPLGIVGVLEKPFPPDALLKKISELLERHGTVGRDETLPMIRPLQIPTALGAAEMDAAERRAAALETPSNGPGQVPADVTPFVTPFFVPEPAPSLEKAGRFEAMSDLAALDDDTERFGPLPQVGFVAGAPLASMEAFAHLSSDATRNAMESLLASALLEAGLGEANALASSISSSVLSGLPAEMLGTFVRTALGVNAFDDPMPALYGDLASVSLGEVLELLSARGMPCVVELSADQRRFGITVDAGSITHVEGRTVQSAFFLIRPLVDAGIVSEQAAADVLADAPHAAPQLGRRLVESGDLAADRFAQALPEQVSLVLSDVLRARSGVFAVDLEPSLHGLPPRGAGVPIQTALQEAAQKVEEMAPFASPSSVSEEPK